MKLSFRVVSLLMLLCVVAVTTAAQPAESYLSPNIIVILADDLGYGDVQAINPASSIPTPNMDRLAREGITFTDAHSGSAVCTPTRYGLLTGRYCWRTRLKQGVLNGYAPHLINPERSTIADLYKQAGYHTACIGKWHLGMDLPMQKGKQIDWSLPIGNTPLSYGFDTFFGITASLDFPPYVFIENDRFTEAGTETIPANNFPSSFRPGPIAPSFKHADCLDILTTKAVNWIESTHTGAKPFFLYFPLTAPHKPVLPHPRFRGKSNLGDYGDFILQVDWTIGELLNTLDRLKISQNTLVILTSDNGSFMYRFDNKCHTKDPTVQGYHPAAHQSNGPLRGTKADIWEGGHRVPFLVRWPERIKAGTECRETICLTDLYATSAELTGHAMDRKEEGEDSFSLVPLFNGKESFEREPVIHHSLRGLFAMRDGAWKLVLGNGSGGRQGPKGEPFAEPYILHNLETGLSETTSQADHYPERVLEMTKRFNILYERSEPPREGTVERDAPDKKGNQP